MYRNIRPIRLGFLSKKMSGRLIARVVLFMDFSNHLGVTPELKVSLRGDDTLDAYTLLSHLTIGL